MERHILYYAGQRLVLQPGIPYRLGREKGADILLDERTVSRSHARLSFDGAAWLLEDLQSTNGTQVNYSPVTTAKLRDGDHISIGPFVCIYRTFSGGSDTEREFDSLLNETLILERKISALTEEAQTDRQRDDIYDLKHFLNALLRRMNALANIDRLTGLFNRRYLDQQLSLEMNRAARYRRGIGIIMIDIDHFKDFNDTYGHQKGDEVLAVVGAILEANTRTTDLAARYGGEEMLIILPEITPGQAQLAAEKIRRCIETETRERTGLKVTASLGVATSAGENITSGELVRRADEALYRAKRNGRNRVEAAGGGAEREQGTE